MENILKTLFPNEIRIASDYPGHSVKEPQKEEVILVIFLKTYQFFQI